MDSPCFSIFINFFVSINNTYIFLNSPKIMFFLLPYRWVSYFSRFSCPLVKWFVSFLHIALLTLIYISSTHILLSVESGTHSTAWLTVGNIFCHTGSKPANVCIFKFGHGSFYHQAICCPEREIWNILKIFAVWCLSFLAYIL